MDEFIFSDDMALLSADAIVISIPKGVGNKEELMSIYEDVLQETGVDYFGKNWDALYDVPTDMSYLVDIAKQIAVVHEDVPMIENKEDLKSYISVLGDALDYHRKKMKRRAPLEVYFAEETKPVLQKL
jgi:RNAse (barnase) inhibitor barstar